ncbi:MAG TPA: hypothetical protein VFW07_23305 [Parafilimonas sp.]|nr:hypothetical protein [Parafilimonas sp.]
MPGDVFLRILQIGAGNIKHAVQIFDDSRLYALQNFSASLPFLSCLSVQTFYLMAQTRRLAAIMFTDIVSYTALMGEDERKAFDILRKSREIQQPIIQQFNGNWIKEIGDGVNIASRIQATAAPGSICQKFNLLQYRLPGIF